MNTKDKLAPELAYTPLWGLTDGDRKVYCDWEAEDALHNAEHQYGMTMRFLALAQQFIKVRYRRCCHGRKPWYPEELAEQRCAELFGIFLGSGDLMRAARGIRGLKKQVIHGQYEDAVHSCFFRATKASWLHWHSFHRGNEGHERLFGISL